MPRVWGWLTDTQGEWIALESVTAEGAGRLYTVLDDHFEQNSARANGAWQPATSSRLEPAAPWRGEQIHRQMTRPEGMFGRWTTARALTSRRAALRYAPTR